MINKRTLVAMLIALVIAGFSALHGNKARVIAGVPNPPVATESINKLTEPKRVASYLQQHHRLPDYYLTKKQARDRGWDAGHGNLCQILPGKAIGGDRFSNREARLPTADKRIWREADINYQCGRRGAERLLYSNDGLIFVTRDHYKNFMRME